MTPLRIDTRAGIRDSIVDALTTPQLLALFERTFAPLDPAARRRIIATAREGGWDRTWDTERIAA